MVNSFHDIASRALALGPSDRLRLAAELVDSVEGRSVDPAWGTAWSVELDRRADEEPRERIDRHEDPRAGLGIGSLAAVDAALTRVGEAPEERASGRSPFRWAPARGEGDGAILRSPRGVLPSGLPNGAAGMRGSGGRSATGGSRRRGPGAGARLGALLLVLGACSDGGWSGTSDLVAEGTVPAGEPQDPAPDDLGFGELVLPWDEEVLGEDAVAPPDLEGVESMRLASLTLEVVSPEGGDLSFVSLAGFYVRADGIDEALLGSQDRFPAGESVVTLDLEDVDLLPYSRAGGVRILVRGGGSMPAAETTLRARITIESSVDDARACDELTGG